MYEISWLFDVMLVPQEELCSVEFSTSYKLLNAICNLKFLLQCVLREY